jgi:ribokinase
MVSIMVPYVVGLGSLNYDYIYIVDKFAAGDHQVVIEDSMGSPGGSAANSIFGLSLLGIRTGFIGTLGDDPEGRLIISEMSKIGIDTSFIECSKDAITSQVLVFVDRYGERAMYTLPGAGKELTIGNSEIDYINDSGFVIISAIPGDQAFNKFVDLVSKLNKNVKLVFLPGGLYSKRGLDELKPIFQRTYLLVMNRRELEYMTNTGSDYRAGIEKLLGYDVKNIVITAGSQGCMVQAGNEYYQVPIKKLQKEQVVDSTGAGDAFTAGMIFGLLSGKPFYDAAICGNLAGRACIQALGARAGLLTISKIENEFNVYLKEISNGK